MPSFSNMLHEVEALESNEPDEESSDSAYGSNISWGELAALENNMNGERLLEINDSDEESALGSPFSEKDSGWDPGSAMDDDEREVDLAEFDTLEDLLFPDMSSTLKPTGEKSQSTTETGLWQTEEMDEALVVAFLDDLPKTACPVELDGDDFVNWFAKVNIFKLSSSFSRTILLKQQNGF